MLPSPDEEPLSEDEVSGEEEETELAGSDDLDDLGVEDDGPRERGKSKGEPEEDPKVVEARKQAEDGEDEPDPKAAKTPIPSEDELLAAMRWAFEKEEVLPGVLESYAKHARLVAEGNRRMNLTAILEPKEVAVKHYLDSWRGARLLPLMGRSVLDIGSGAGFPGMPTALAEDMCKVVMVDSRKKKAEFMAETIEQMGVKNASAVWSRGEDYLLSNKVNVVLVRGLSSVRENVRMLRKVRHAFSDLVLFKGPSWSREMRAAEREAERLGFHLDTVLEHELPEEMGKRALLVYRAPGAQ